MAEFEKELELRRAPLDEIRSDLRRSDAVMKEFETKRDVLGDELWKESAKLMVDGYKNQLLQAIVVAEGLKTFINSNDSHSEEMYKYLAQLDEWLAHYKDEYEKNKKLRDIVRNFEKKNGVR